MRSHFQKFPDKKVKIAGIVVFRRKNGKRHNPANEVLLLERHDGRWDLPKGHVEEGETFLEGALRECKEETGLDHHKNLDIHPFHYISIPSKKWLRFYLGFTQGDDIDISDEHFSYHWVPLSEAIQLLGPTNHFSHAIEMLSIPASYY
jgi:8-oxo-dGTP pyrophosphatase MutT (NUDIX family)